MKVETETVLLTARHVAGEEILWRDVVESEVGCQGFAGGVEREQSGLQPWVEAYEQ